MLYLEKEGGGGGGDGRPYFLSFNVLSSLLVVFIINSVCVCVCVCVFIHLFTVTSLVAGSGSRVQPHDSSRLQGMAQYYRSQDVQ